MVQKEFEEWTPSLAVKKGGVWRANKKMISPSSFLAASLKVDMYVEALSTHARGDLIDLGCGNAPYLGAYKERVESITLADWSHSSHSLIKTRLNVDLNSLLPFESDSYDTVLLSEVLEHISYPERLVNEISRILRPGGTAIIGVPFMYWLHEEPHDYHRFTKHKLLKLAEDVGLDVLSLQTSGGGLDVVHDALMKMFTKRKCVGLGSKIAYFFVWLYSKLRKNRPIRKINKRWTNKFPLGYLMVLRKSEVSDG